LIEIDSLHLSDGMLRILAILSQSLTTESILIFDEIEDGINQEFVEKLVDTLLNSHHQTIVATHSPLLLNYLDDTIAKESILFVYKAQDGSTQMENFFEVIAKHQQISDHEYDLFGPGEIMQRVNLLELTQKLRQDANNEDSD
jgi:predicted ATPase